MIDGSHQIMKGSPVLGVVVFALVVGAGFRKCSFVLGVDCLKQGINALCCLYWTRWDGPMSGAAKSCFRRSGNPNLIGPNHDQLKPMT